MRAKYRLATLLCRGVNWTTI